ncbi:ActS/PrrB/RegB family redox-sensitive histidine kinase [Alphaproteobacteria bacterium]|nr:ActS/PrrB/RegB family redox-sensitive histidine kinase [Alphaproteobacteria bacterium]
MHHSLKLSSIPNNILLINLIKIRWLAIIGQVSAILISYYYLEIFVPIFFCLLIIAVSAFVNLISFFRKKINNYLSDKEAFYFLLFDTLQLGILLYFTGGIYNPFSLLLIAPLIISASYLPIVFSIILSLLSIIIVILISYFYIPINWNDSFKVPDIFIYGLSLSLIISLIFIAIYVYLLASSSRNIAQALFHTRSVLANQKKLSEIGSMSAAAVHEISTPLNTIFLILNDLREEKIVKNNSEIKKEIELLKSQAEKCKVILLTLSQNPQNLKDKFFDNTTLSNIIKTNFDKFNNRKVKLQINIVSQKIEPTVSFKDELMYCIGNIIQNAIQHANSIVKVNIYWDNVQFKIIVNDDGNGFAKETLDQIGNPYISKHNNGMGLGIFIAKNLIENIKGSIFCKNQKEGGGSVEIIIFRDNSNL